MAKTMKVSYEDALDAAYEHWAQFYDEKEHFDLVRGERSRDWQEFQRRELRVMANSACTAEWMLCDMFGLPEERVHEDLMALRTRERANA